MLGRDLIPAGEIAPACVQMEFGMDELDTIAAAVLQKHGGDVDMALPDFLSALADSGLIKDLVRQRPEQSLFDLDQKIDGRRYGDMTLGELEAMAAAARKDYPALALVDAMVARLQQYTTDRSIRRRNRVSAHPDLNTKDLI